MIKSVQYILIASFLFLTSCTFYSPDLQQVNRFDVEEIKDGKVKLIFDADVLNENAFSLKIKKSILSVYVEDEFIGYLNLDKKIKLKRKRVTHVSAPMTLTLTKGMLLKLMKILGKEEANIRLKGDLKGGIFFLSKKISVDERKKIKVPKLKGGFNG